MSDDQEQIIEDGMSIQELTRSAGWAVLERELDAVIDAETASLSEIETDGKDPAEIGTEYVSHVQYRRGLRRVRMIIEDVIARKDEAQQES